MILAKINGEKINLETFKKASSDMVAVSSSAYASDYSFLRANKHTEYTKEEVEEIISSGDSEELRELSMSFFYSSGYYRRIMLYYATFLKYTPIIIPHLKDGVSITDPKYKKRYHNCLSFFNQIDFEKLCINFTLKVLVEGGYYGILREKDGKICVQSLPFEYCRSRFTNYEGINIVELDLKYFDGIRDKEKRDECLKSFPNDVRKAYNTFHNKNGSNWYTFEAGTGVYFNLCEERPFMLNVIPAIIDLHEYREIEKAKDKQALKKVLVQQMPLTNDGELVFDPEEVSEMHRGVVGMLKKTPEIDVLTSFGKVSLEDMQDTRQTIANNLEKIEKIIYGEAGVTKQVFSAESNNALQRSIENDMALMMFLAKSYALWLGYILNYRFGDSKISFNATILPISYYNTDEYISKTLNMAQYGYSFLVPCVALGINQADILDIKTLEIDLLRLNDKLVPLQSSHTQSGKNSKQNSSAEINENKVEGIGNNPNNEKSETEKSDKTLANENSSGGV